MSSPPADVDAIVIGAGAVGLACACALATEGLDVLVVERHGRVGTETSSRNSGVIHAGIHGPIDSLKSRACIAGRQRLYAWCAARNVPHRRTGKLIVAREGEVDTLDTLAHGAVERGLGVRRLDARDLAREEPLLRGRAAIEVAESGIVDAHAFVDSLRRASLDRGAQLVLGHAVTRIDREGSLWRVEAGSDALRARLVVNAAGLHADTVAERAGLDVDARGWRIHPWKGDYFRIDARGPTHALVYPLPVRGGLGVHLTRDASGKLLAGPDANPGDGYAVDAAKRDAFVDAVRRYWPSVDADAFHPDYAGVRPKLRADGGFADFVVAEEPAGLIHLIGIESPGLTASLELAEHVRLTWVTRDRI